MQLSLDLVRPHLDRLLASREFPKTICPSEAARALSSTEIRESGAETWRDLMPLIREETFRMRDGGEVDILQKGKVLGCESTLENTTGPIRLRKPREGAAT